MFNWFRKSEVQKEPEQPKARKSLFSTHSFDEFDPDNKKFKIDGTVSIFIEVL